jgi:hypothetical protein
VVGTTDQSPLTDIPAPGDINRRIGELCRELALLRRLLRLSLAARRNHQAGASRNPEAAHGGQVARSSSNKPQLSKTARTKVAQVKPRPPFPVNSFPSALLNLSSLSQARA